MNWQEAKILFKYASRSRSARFFEGLDSIANNVAQPKNCVVVCSFDTDDKTMDTPEVREKLMQYGIQLIIHRGESQSKIHAINRNLDHLHDAEIIICMSDDMRFTVKGFDDIIRNTFAEHFPNGDGCLHFPDQHQGNACMTMNITDARYHNRFGFIYHPDYVSVECDLENQEVAEMLGCYKYIDQRIFIHLHPSFGDIAYDAQYTKTENWAVHEADKETRRRRKKNNYDLIKVGDKWETVPREIKTEPMTEPQAPQDRLTQLRESVEKTEKLRAKFLSKIDKLKSDAEEINALGIVKIEVSVTEESLK